MTKPSDVTSTIGYVLACQPLHEGLRRAATQLGGLSLMVMFQRGRGFDLETPLKIAAATVDEIRDAIGALAVPEAAAHHFHHMTAAAVALRDVADLMSAGAFTRGTELGRAGISTRLSAATDHLRRASRALPGFEMVDLTQSCCAAHAATAPTAESARELRF